MFHRKKIYLDVASATPVRRVSLDEFINAQSIFGNPSSPHDYGLLARELLENARARIANVVETKSDDIVFTSGATEANALATLGIARNSEHVLYAPSAHASIVKNMESLKERGCVVEPLPVCDGKIDVNAMKTMLRSETTFIAMDAVCGETGTIWNTREVSRALPRRTGKRKIILHVDASQAPCVEKCMRTHFGADTMSLDSGKVGGVRGIGCLVASRMIGIRSLYYGGSQERGLRSGTQNPALASSFASALEKSAEERDSFGLYANPIRTKLAEDIISSIPNSFINIGKINAPHILNVSLVGRDTDYVVALLNEAGYAVSTKSACETDSVTGSRAVFALTGDIERAKSTLRISWDMSVKAKDITRFSVDLANTVAFVDSESTKSHY